MVSIQPITWYTAYLFYVYANFYPVDYFSINVLILVFTAKALRA